MNQELHVEQYRIPYLLTCTCHMRGYAGPVMQVRLGVLKWIVVSGKYFITK